MLEETTLSEEQHDLVATMCAQHARVQHARAQHAPRACSGQTVAHARHARRSRTSGETLLSLICDILDFSRIEAQKLLLEERPFDLEEALERALQICCMSAAKKRINVTCSVEDGVPCQLVGDAGRLQQVLLNALGNSLKFTPDGGVVELRCSTTTNTEGHPLLHIAVADSGIGISPAGLAKLFNSFSQVDSSPSRKYDGAGLGLAISRRLCEAMGGTMSAVSPGLGCGSTFNITFALKRARALSPGGAKPADACSSTFPTLAGRRLVVVDKCAPVRAALAQWLRTWGAAEVAEAACPGSLAELLERGAGPDGSEAWDAVITEACAPLLHTVLSHLDGPGPACAQDTCADSGGGGGLVSSLCDHAGRAPPTGAAGATLRVFAMAWPSMPAPPTDPKFPAVVPRSGFGGSSVAPVEGALPVLDTPEIAETSPQDLIPCCVTVWKPVRKSRLRDALAAAFGPDVAQLRINFGDDAAVPGSAGATGGFAGAHPLHNSNSMASFASCGDVGDCAAQVKLTSAAAAAAAAAAAGAAAPLTSRSARDAAGAGAATPAAASLRVMLAEDHVINQKVVVSLLNRYGHKVVCVANDGLDALDKLRNTPGGPAAFDGA
jgi:hypothetical protein